MKYQYCVQAVCTPKTDLKENM